MGKPILVVGILVVGQVFAEPLKFRVDEGLAEEVFVTVLYELARNLFAILPPQ